ncbi:MAG: hypothetical protein JKY93_02040 [Gammaproteobacteria bacterium]|nr:hypothetical protein [Gammaproteobacteria bacterium]
MSSNDNLNSYLQFLDSRRGKIFSSRGGWRAGEAIWNCGHSMMHDLVGEKTYFQVFILNMTKKLPEKEVADWFEWSCMCLSWPDPRIWCNHIGTLAGSLRCSPVAGVSAGNMAQDSRMFGCGVMPDASAFIQKAKRQHDSGMTVTEIIDEDLASKRVPPGSTPVVVGFARPLAKGDERVDAMEIVAKELGFEVGPHMAIANQVHNELVERQNEGINFAGYCAAFMSDQGFTVKEIHRLYNIWVVSGVNACYAEGFDNPPETFLPRRCDDVNYVGVENRTLPG